MKQTSFFMTLFLIVSLSSSIVAASECLVTTAGDKEDEGSFYWAIDQLSQGGCGTSDHRYREKYESFFPGNISYYVVRFDHSLTIELQEKLTVPDVPGVLVFSADERTNVTLTGSTNVPAMSIVRKNIIFDHITFQHFTDVGLDINQGKGVLIASHVTGNGIGVRLLGTGHTILDSEIDHNQRHGVVITSATQPGDECRLTELRTHARTKIWGNHLHHNGGTGILVDAFGVEIKSSGTHESLIHHNEDEGVLVQSLPTCWKEGDPFSSSQIRTATIQSSAVYANKKENIFISHFPLPPPQKLSLSPSPSNVIISGSIIFPDDSSLPWNKQSIDVTELWIHVAFLDREGKQIIAGSTRRIDENGQFSISVSEEFFETHDVDRKALVAQVTDEERNNSSAWSSGSDQDGVSDGEEESDESSDIPADETDPLPLDTDGDGVSDEVEIKKGTDPNVCDTDGDGLSDGVELQVFSSGTSTETCHGLSEGGSNYRHPSSLNPLKNDSDGDGLLDGEEDGDGNGWIDRTETDPSLSDTDGDDVDDGAEMTGDLDHDGLPDFDFTKVVGSGKCLTPISVDDIDCDDIPNARDDDADHDGCSDKDEANAGDQNKNGIPDLFDPQAKSCTPVSTSGSFGGGGASSSENDKEGERFSPLPSWIQTSGDGPACQFIPSAQRGISSYFLMGFSLFLMFFWRNIIRR